MIWNMSQVIPNKMFNCRQMRHFHRLLFTCPHACHDVCLVLGIENLSSLPNCSKLCNRESRCLSRASLSRELSCCSASILSTSTSLALSSSAVFCSLLQARESLIYLFTRNLLICDKMLPFVHKLKLLFRNSNNSPKKYDIFCFIQ